EALRYARTLQHRKVALLPPWQIGPSQRTIGTTRVHYTTRRQRIEGQRGIAGRREVASDINHDVGSVAGIDADGSVCSRRYDGRIGLDASVERNHGCNRALALPGGIDRQK